MAKKKKQINKKNDEQLEKARLERELVTSQVNTRFKSPADISVDPEFKEISVMLDPPEFDDSKKNFETERASFRYESCDNSMMSTKYSYKLK